MLFQKIGRAQPEKVFVIAKNSWSTASLANGDVVIWDWVTDCDGVSVRAGKGTNAVSNGLAVAGVAAETIAHNAYGLIQCYGYHSAVKVQKATTTGHIFHESRANIAKGTPLVGDGADGSLNAIGITCAETANVVFPMGFSFGAYTLYTVSTVAAFIKAL